MLRVTSLRGGRSADYYVGLADDQARRDGRERLARGPADYYVDTGEPPGRWWGAQAEAWGLAAGDGLVDGQDLRRLLDGQHPRAGVQLGRAYSDGGVRPSVRGFDATFSMPKSASVLWAITDSPEVRAHVEAAGWAAVTATLAHLQRVGAVTRVGPAGAQVQLDTGGLAAAIFEQHTNRSAEPQLHWHAVIAAKVDAGQGRWRALDAQFLKRHQSSLGYVFQAAVRAELTARLGVNWGPTVKGAADIVGIHRTVIEAFASRSADVDAAYAGLLAQWRERNGRDEPARFERHNLRQSAAMASRGPKEPGYSPDDLRSGWQADLRLSGIEPADLVRSVLHRSTVPGHDLVRETRAAALPALGDLAAEQGQWHHAETMKALAARVRTGPATAGALVATLDSVATETLGTHALAIAPEPLDGVPKRADGRPVVERVIERTWTTPQLWEAEERLARWALVAELMGDRAELAPESGRGLDPAQADAAAEVAGTRPLVVLVGPAGTGKTRLLEAARSELDAAPRPVVGLAVAAATAQRLADDTGLVCDTVAKLLYAADHGDRPSRLPPVGTTLVIDEATQVTTQQWSRLVDLAEHQHWRLVAVGDPGQIGAVGAGGIFAAWADQYRWTVELDRVHRFAAEWERDASIRLRIGDPDALAVYADQGRIDRTTARTLAHDVVAHWERQRRNHGEVLVTAGSNRLAGDLNAAIQAHRISSGELPRDAPSATVAGGQRVRVDEPLVTRRNDRRRLTSTGEWIRNGHQWTVTKVHTDGAVSVQGREPSQGDATLPASYLAEHAQLGYVVTRHVGQGATVDTALTIAEPGIDRPHLYSAMTRGRHENNVLVVCDTADQQPLAILEDALGRDRQARTAHQTADQLVDRYDTVARHWGWQQADDPVTRNGAEQGKHPVRPTPREGIESLETHGQALARITAELGALELRNLSYNSQSKTLRQQLDEIDQGRGAGSAAAHSAWGVAARTHRRLQERPPRFRAHAALERSNSALDEAHAQWKRARAAERSPVETTLRGVEQTMKAEWSLRQPLLDERAEHAWYIARGGAGLPTAQQLDRVLGKFAARGSAQLMAVDEWHRRHPWEADRQHSLGGRLPQRDLEPSGVERGPFPTPSRAFGLGR